MSDLIERRTNDDGSIRIYKHELRMVILTVFTVGVICGILIRTLL